MKRAVPLALAALVGSALVPTAAAGAPSAEPLQDVAPVTTEFEDRVLTTAPPTATASATRTLRTADGNRVRVSVSGAYRRTRRVARSYVDFLGSLPHGGELSRLRMVIATPAQVRRRCGSPQALACYTTAGSTMIVPGQQISGGRGVTTSYVVAHEYGHHLAAFRRNPPFRALDYGPKYWASQRLVCAGVLDGRLAPGDEGSRYVLNPGEAWAETYAQLRYPEVPWSFAPRLRPTAGALAAARRDVLAPWRRTTTRTFTGDLSAERGRRSFTFDLRLDGALRFALDGPPGAHYDLRVASGDTVLRTTRAPGSDDVIAYSAACRDRPVERIRLTVLRRSGSCPFSLSACYAG